MAENHRRPPPENVSQLKDNIDAGAVAGKVRVPDPGAADLGTDDEAGGAAPAPAEVRLAAATEPRARRRTSSWTVAIVVAAALGVAVAVGVAFAP